jgi:alpha-L-fucosidase
MRAILDRTFSTPVASAAFPAPAIQPASTAPREIAVAAGRRFDVAMLQEDIRQGQRVEQFTLEMCSAGACREFARGTTIGYKRLLRFPEVRVDAASRDARVRLTVTQSRGTPAVSALSVYSMGPLQAPPAAPGVSR